MTATNALDRHMDGEVWYVIEYQESDGIWFTTGRQADTEEAATRLLLEMRKRPHGHAYRLVRVTVSQEVVNV